MYALEANPIKPMRLSLFNNEDEPEVSMSPLIDCVFLLLIFFLVSTMTKVKNRDIPVDLPTSQSAVKLKPDDKQAIVVPMVIFIGTGNLVLPIL